MNFLAKRGSKKKKSSNGGLHVKLTDVASLLVVGSGILGGNFVNDLKSGNLESLGTSIAANVQANAGQILTGIAIGVGGRALRKARLSPRVGMKGLSVGV